VIKTSFPYSNAAAAEIAARSVSMSPKKQWITK
jgi:hypothetical protein